MIETAKRPEEPSGAVANRRALAHLFDEFERARAERDSATTRMSRFAETIQLLIDALPNEDRVELQRRFDELRSGGASQGRGGEVFSNVIALFRREKRKEWSFSEIQGALRKDGATVDDKAIYNVVNYLAKMGRIQRISRGRYVVTDLGMGFEFEGIDHGTTRATEHEI